METATYKLPSGGTVTYLLEHPRHAEDIPPGLVAVHNVDHYIDGPIALRGFRVMVETLDPMRAERCTCPWAGGVLDAHYRRRRT